MSNLIDRITEEWVNRGILPATDYKKDDEDSDEEKDDEEDD